MRQLIERLRELNKLATGSPWAGDPRFGYIVDEDGDLVAQTFGLGIERNVALVVEMRNALPGLLQAAEQLQELHEQVAQMCEHLGSKRDEVPCDSWHLRDLIMRLAPAGHERAALAEQAARLLRNHVAGENVDDPMHQWADEWDHVVAQPGADRAER